MTIGMPLCQDSQIHVALSESQTQSLLMHYVLCIFHLLGIDWQLIDLFHVVKGVVYWQPPRQALNKVKELVWEPSISRYGADEGIPELREALMQKVSDSEHSCFQLDDLCYGSGHWHMKGRQRSFDSLLAAAFQLFDAHVVII
jgi:hypothetical protein